MDSLFNKINLLNKIIYFDNYLFKIVKITKQNYIISPLIIDYSIDIEKEYFHAYDILHMESIDIRHYKNVLENDIKFTVKKETLENTLIIVDNLKGAYIHNRDLKYGFNDVLGSDELKHQFIKDIQIQYYIQLLTNEEIKEDYKKWRKEQFKIFINLINCPCCSNEKYIYSMIENNLLIEYQELKKEYENNEDENIEHENIEEEKLILVNEACPVCLNENIEVYKGFYKCCHCICKTCFENWEIKTCPICREEEGPALTPYLGSIN